MTIEVHIDQTGDWAEVEGDLIEEDAISCAKVLAREAYDGSGGSIRPTITFRLGHEDGESEVILASVPEPELWHWGRS